VTPHVITPWYRQPWPWFLIALPATAVVAGIVTAVLAVRTYDGPVTADYYKQGLAINEEVARADLARELSLRARVELAGLADGSRIRVELDAARALPPEAALRLRARCISPDQAASHPSGCANLASAFPLRTAKCGR